MEILSKSFRNLKESLKNLREVIEEFKGNPLEMQWKYFGDPLEITQESLKNLMEIL